jgi:hypothetical protein
MGRRWRVGAVVDGGGRAVAKGVVGWGGTTRSQGRQWDSGDGGVDDGGANELFFDVLLVCEQTGGGDGQGVVEQWALVAQGYDGGEMVNNFYFCSKKSVVFLLSNGEEGSEKVTQHGHINPSDRMRRERRSRRKGNLKGGSRGGNVVLVVFFNTSLGVNGCRQGGKSRHLSKELAPVLGDCSNVVNSLLDKVVRSDGGLELEIT